MVAKNAKPISSASGLMDLKKIMLDNSYKKSSGYFGKLEEMNVMPAY
jgi:hypothetical protein